MRADIQIPILPHWCWGTGGESLPAAQVPERFGSLFAAAERGTEAVIGHWGEQQRGELNILITPVSLAEVLAGPIKTRKEALVERYESALTEGLGWKVVSLTSIVASKAARLRIRYGLKLPDAFQFAVALSHLAFGAGDSRLRFRASAT